MSNFNTLELHVPAFTYIVTKIIWPVVSSVTSRVQISVSCYVIKLYFWPWPRCWKMVHEHLPLCYYRRNKKRQQKGVTRPPSIVFLSESKGPRPTAPVIWALDWVFAWFCRKLKQPAFLDGASQPVEPAPRKQPIQLPKDAEEAPASPTSPPAPAAPEAEDEDEEEEEDLYDDASVPSRQPEAPAPSLMSRNLPRRPPSDDEDDEYQNWDGAPAFCLIIGSKPAG